MRNWFAGLRASAARWMSLSFARASEQTVLSFTSDAMVWIASKSPFELARDAEFFVLGHRGARRLLAIAQGRVEDEQAVGHGNSFAKNKTARCVCKRAGRRDVGTRSFSEP